MAKTYNRLEIDVNAAPYDIITAVQADTNSRYLDVSLYENGLPIDLTGHEVKIFMQKPENGGEIWNDGTITDAAAGRCEFLMTTEALAKMGHLQAQISVWKDNEEILSTQIFRICVTKSLLTESAVEASNEYGTIVLLFQKLYEAYDLMTAMVENFGKAGATAASIPAGTFWQMLEALYLMTQDALKNASVSEVLTRIGQTADTGGSETAGTVMGKLNALYQNSAEETALRKREYGAVQSISVQQTSSSSQNPLYNGANTTLLDIQGKGRFLYFHGHIDQTDTAGKLDVRYKIIVDGESVLNFYATGTDDNSTRTNFDICAFSMRDIYFAGVNTSNYYMLGLPYSTMMSRSSSENIRCEKYPIYEEIKYEWSNYASYREWFISDDFICFQKSLRIEVYGNNSADVGNVQISYQLER